MLGAWLAGNRESGDGFVFDRARGWLQVSGPVEETEAGGSCGSGGGRVDRVRLLPSHWLSLGTRGTHYPNGGGPM